MFFLKILKIEHKKSRLKISFKTAVVTNKCLKQCQKYPKYNLTLEPNL